MEQQQPPAPPSLQSVPPMSDTMDDASDTNETPRVSHLPTLVGDEIETEDDCMADNSSPEPHVRIYTPPPHIAARIYRPSASASASAQARRKTSATSSRRNSISSTHSRSSHGYGRPTGASASGAVPQSKHVAQHLRRASILADRKARLADRAAHAEQVRLRAALAKAAVKDISLSEERAQAATQAREKKLEEIAAACAEEVKRAKAVAESIKEKREQNLLRLRQQIKDRLDEAERRRDELRRNNAAGRTRSRGQSMVNGRKQVEVMPQVAELKETSALEQADDALTSSPPSELALTPEEAAFKISQWWRKSYRRRAIAGFQQLGLAVDSVRDTSFEEVVELLGQQHVILATGKVLRLCGIHEGKASSTKEIVVVRTFLSAFLILGHPTHVLSDRDSQSSSDVGSRGTQLASSKATEAGTTTSGPSGTAPLQPAMALDIAKDDVTNPQLQDLVGKAKDLLIGFETILSRLSPANKYTPPQTLAHDLVDAYDGFYDAFIAWKARDASTLIEFMIKQFVELDAIWQTVKDNTDESVSDTYRESIRNNQLMLMVRIKQLAGAEQGKKRVFNAVRKARKAKEESNRKAAAAAKASAELKPREAKHTTIETAMGSLTGEGQKKNMAASTTASTVAVTARSTTASAGNTKLASMDRTAMAHALISKLGVIDVPQDSAMSALPDSVSDDAPDAEAEARMRNMRFCNEAQVSLTNPMPPNRVLVHELAMNGKFRLSATAYKITQAAALKPYFDRMRKTMAFNTPREQEEHFFFLLVIVDSLRNKLSQLTEPGKKMHQFINELLDTEVAQRQFNVGSFSYERFFISLGQLLPKLCAPVRDDEVKDLIDNKLQQGNYVDRLQAVCAFIDVMVVDHVNFLISIVAPQLLLSASDYETRRFADLVLGEGAANSAASTDSASAPPSVSDATIVQELPAAATAWRAARGKILTDIAKRDPEGINHPKSRPTPDQFYSQMLVNVFTQLHPIPWYELPEMLRLDHTRALKTGAATRRIVTAGALLLQCKNLLKRDVRLPWKTEAHRILTVLEKAEKDAIAADGEGPPLAVVVDGVMAALESGRAMPPATRTQLRGYVQRTIAAYAGAAEAVVHDTTGDAVLQEPVLRLLLHRLRGYLMARLSAGSASEKARQSSATGERLASLGLAEFVDGVRDIVDDMLRVAEVDRETHSAFWDAIANRVDAEPAPAASSS